ncbi:MAG: GNAT family N-acetyltransferase, partial [Myxococcota bacterium]|nr:GNAT family N-acetyltransferase [Myxococcota bacterium]
SDPIRWGIGCPLEALIDDALLLDAVEPYHRKQAAPSFRVRRWSQDALWEDEEALRAHFQLLLTAHYRTRPSDLWRLLDAPNMSLFSVYKETSTDCPLVVALVAEEGGLSEEIVRGLYEGRARIRGHLLAANLILNCGAESGGALKSWRVVRIATRPDVRRQGLATQLLERVIAQAIAEGVSLFGSSFALSADVLRFWSKVGCVPLRVSSRVSQSSGAHSLLVARPLDIAGARCLAPLSASAPERFVDALSDPLRQLEPHLAAALGPRLASARGAARPPLMLSQEDWRWLASCSYGTRPYEVAPGIAWRLVSYWLLDPTPPQLPKEIAELLIAKVLQRQRWTPLCRRFGLESPTLAMRGVVSGLRLLFEAYAPTNAQREALRFPRGPTGEVAESLSPKESSEDSI